MKICCDVRRSSVIGLFYAFVAGCGGGGGGDGNPPTANQAPTAQISGPSSVNSLDTVVLSAASSSDPDGTPLTYQWTQMSGQTAYFADTASVSLSFPAPNLAENGSIQVRLTVTDPSGASDTDELTIAIAALDLRPELTTEDVTLDFQGLTDWLRLQTSRHTVSTSLESDVPIIGGRATLEFFSRDDGTAFFIDVKADDHWSRDVSVPVYLRGGTTHNGIISRADVVNGFLYALHMAEPAAQFEEFLANFETSTFYQLLQSRLFIALEGRLDPVTGRMWIQLFDEATLEAERQLFEAEYAATFGGVNDISIKPIGEDPALDERAYCSFLNRYAETTTGLLPKYVHMATWCAALAPETLPPGTFKSLQKTAGPTTGPHMFQTAAEEDEGRGGYSVQNPRQALFGLAIDESHAGLTGARDGLLFGTAWVSPPKFYTQLPDGDYRVLLTTGFLTESTSETARKAQVANLFKLGCVVLDALAACFWDSDAIAKAEAALRNFENSGILTEIRDNVLKYLRNEIGGDVLRDTLLRTIESKHLNIWIKARGTPDLATRDATYTAAVSKWRTAFKAVGTIFKVAGAVNTGIPFLYDIAAGPNDVRFCAVLEEGLLTDEDQMRVEKPTYTCKVNVAPSVFLRIGDISGGTIGAEAGGWEISKDAIVTYDASDTYDDRTDEADLQFRFEYRDASGNVITAQDYGPGRTFQVAHQLLGDFTVQVTVRDEAGLTSNVPASVKVVDTGVQIVSPSSSSVPLASPVPVAIEVKDPGTAVGVEISVGTFIIRASAPAPASGQVTATFTPSALGFQDGGTATIRARVTRSTGEIEVAELTVTFGDELVLPGPGQGTVRIRGTYENDGLTPTTRSEDLSATVEPTEGAFADGVRRLSVLFTMGDEHVLLATSEPFTGNGTYTLLQESQGVLNPVTNEPVGSSILLDQCRAPENDPQGITSSIPSGQITVSDYQVLSTSGAISTRQLTVQFQARCVSSRKLLLSSETKDADLNLTGAGNAIQFIVVAP